MAFARLKGLAVTLNMHLTAVRRYVDQWDEARLRRELALAAAFLDGAREDIGEAEIAARAAEAREVPSREMIEVGSAEGFALWSQTYHDEADNPLIALEELVLEPLLGEVAGLRVLDVGCGTGRHALRLAARGADVTGLDPSPEMLAVAREQARLAGLTLTLEPGGFGALPTGGDFDLVVCNLVLCHVPDLDAAIAGIAACLRPGGRVVISDFHYMCLAIGWRTRFDHEGRAYQIENYQHSYGDYLRALRAAGLTVTLLEDLMVEERLRDCGMGQVVDKWEGFPFGMVIAAEK